MYNYSMKFRSLVTLALFVVFSLSLVHEYAFFDDDHCSTIEHTSKLATSTSHGDICDLVCESHQSFLLLQKIILPDVEYRYLDFYAYKQSYKFKNPLDLFRPPINNS